MDEFAPLFSLAQGSPIIIVKLFYRLLRDARRKEGGRSDDEIEQTVIHYGYLE